MGGGIPKMDFRSLSSGEAARPPLWAYNVRPQHTAWGLHPSVQGQRPFAWPDPETTMEQQPPSTEQYLGKNLLVTLDSLGGLKS